MNALLSLMVLCAPAGVHDDLVGNRLVFNDAKTAVPVRLMEDQKKVTLSGSDALVVELVDASDKVVRTLRVPKDVPLVVERTGGRAASVVERWVLETLEREGRTKRRQARQRWRKRGLRVDLVEVGGSYGVGGTVVDNRATLITVRQEGLSEAAIVKRFGVRPERLVTLESPPAIAWVARAGDQRVAAKKIAPQLVRVTSTGAITVKRVHHSIGYKEEGFADRQVRGTIVLAPDRAGRIAVVNLLPLWAYVAGILPSEMFASAPLEALKAQAVTARGELFAKIGRRHLTDPYLVCSEQHCQVYKGRSAEHPRTNEAARQTLGELAFREGRLVDSVYSACCGGHTEDAHVVWARPANPALTGRVDGKSGQVPSSLTSESAMKKWIALPRSATWCGASSFNKRGNAYRWTKRLSAQQVNAMTRDLNVGRVRELVVEGRGPGGRLKALKITGDKGVARVYRELPVRRRFGNLRSGAFLVEHERDATGALTALTFRGGGFGHGSGMCQQGAIGMAEAGHSYRDILSHYYNGAVVRKVF